MNIYVGNLAYAVTEDDLREAFGAFGQVASAKLIIDHASGQSKGFGFVEMDDGAEAGAAIKGLNGTALKDREMTVNEAKPRGDRPRQSSRY